MPNKVKQDLPCSLFAFCFSASTPHPPLTATECIVYAVAGTAVLATLSEDHDAHDDSDSTVPPPPPTRHVLGPGDFVFIPAWTEHQVANESPDTDVVWVVVRTGPEPTVVPLSEWGGPEASF